MKITIERPRCIGCGSCSALCPNYFELDQAGLSHFLGSKAEPQETDELVTDDLGCVQEAIDACPVQCIKVVI
ncbi:MAG: ferredoxin [Candidatus Gribaldobacteria bacterium]|nr:ferredoxin [Candidatus Gribaldobacteria bacterium]